jgi:recombination protein RecA
MAELSKERDRKLKDALSEIEKDVAKGALVRMGEMPQLQIEGITTGSLTLDIALGGKGIPRGRIIEVFGPESSGKTTVALTCVANAQKQGGVAAYIDAEHALDPSWAKRLGVNLEDLLVSQPGHGEEALRIVELLVKHNAVDIIVIDSVAALVPKAEIDGDIGQAQVGLHARLMSQALRVINPHIGKTRCSVVFINQVRQKIGIAYGNPEVTTGGLALKFYASVRMEVRKGPYIKKGEEPVGTEVNVKVVKNKVAPPFRTATFELMFDSGISKEADILTLGQEDELIDKKGNWLYYGELSLGNGSEKAKEFLRENANIMEELTQKILAKRKPSDDEPVSADEEMPKELAELGHAVPTPAPKEKETPAPSGRRGRKEKAPPKEVEAED